MNGHPLRRTQHRWPPVQGKRRQIKHAKPKRAQARGNSSVLDQQGDGQQIATRQATMEERAVVDRIVDGKHIVLLVGEAGLERILPLESLPTGISEGDCLRVQYSGDTLIEATLDPEATSAAQSRVAAKLALLRQRKSRAPREQS